MTDKLRLSVYPRSSGEGERLGVLGSGTRVTVLKSQGGYAKIRTSDGLEGWVKAAYLQKAPTAALRLAQLEQEKQRLEAELEQLRSTGRETVCQGTERAGDARGEAQLAALQEELRSLQTVHQALLEEYEALKAASVPTERPGTPGGRGQASPRVALGALAAHPWLWGGLALLVGLLLGVITGRTTAEYRWRKRFYGFRLE